MTKRLAAGLLAVALLLTACTGKDTPSESIFEKEPVREKLVFEFADIENPGYTMVYEPLQNALTQMALGLNMAQSTDSDGATDGQYDSNYIIYDSDTNTQRATVQVRTAPPNPEEVFSADSPEAVTDAMRPLFFPALDIHAANRITAVEDFGFKLVIDWSGTAYGWNASYLEFIDEESQRHSLRFYMSNDEMNANFYAFEYKADLPAGDQVLIDLYRSILFSLHPM